MAKLYCTHNDCRATVILEIGQMAKKLNRPDLLEMAQCVPEAEVRCRHVARPAHTNKHSPDAPLPPPMVTRGDGVPLPDQEAALEEFKRQCLHKTEEK